MIAIDLSLLEEYACDDPAKLSRLTRLAYDSIEEGLAPVSAAAANGDLAALGECAHRAKSTARHAGAEAFAEACIALEQAAQAGHTELAQHLARELVGTLPLLRQSLASALRSHGVDTAGL